MRMPLIRQGTGPVRALELLREEQEAIRAKIDRIEFETSLSSTTPVARRRVWGGTAGGDSRKLRGVPAIGRSVQGVIYGTCPHIDGIPD